MQNAKQIELAQSAITALRDTLSDLNATILTLMVKRDSVEAHIAKIKTTITELQEEGE